MADNCVLTRRILHLEDRLAALEREFTSPPKAESGEDNPVIPELLNVLSEPVLHRSAWVGPFKDVLSASLEGRKRRQREQLQCQREAKALRSARVPSLSTVVIDQPDNEADP
ncbi:hypothetical protein BDM02DRAFT_3194484 [Thelephora ganbajun]|uniref:Uncharacterized protein n=1 Tax=Thelephora ganbajun TaxID=370292 RepID=A0ACB6YX34_THEGA|nr:hypothetical protein BDM02DRAFT_3194484 [Thelephora ganbajun]